VTRIRFETAFVATFAVSIPRHLLGSARNICEVLGARKGQLKTAQKQFGAVSKEDRPAAGQQFNQTKQAIEEALEQAQQRLQAADDPDGQKNQQFDPSLPGQSLQLGHLHPITQTIEELKDIADIISSKRSHLFYIINWYVLTVERVLPRSWRI